MSKSKKLRKSNNKKVYMTTAQRYALVEAAKDGVFDIINANKFRWGYENWAQMLSYVRCSDYKSIERLVVHFHESASKHDMLELLRDINTFSF